MVTQVFDPTEIRKCITVMKPNNELFEIRIIHNKKKNVISGYFRDAETMLAQLRLQDLSDANVYITLNSINGACFDRKQKEMFLGFNDATTSDNDVLGYEWLMIDIDPDRPKGTSSTDEQLKESKLLGNKIYNYLNEQGFKQPLLAVSGNGVHLMYRINLKNNADDKKLVGDCLKALDLMFSNDIAKVDLTTFNPSRVHKLYGTYARKGSSSEERPHRMAKIIFMPEELEITEKMYLQKLVKIFAIDADADKPKSYNGYRTEFNLEEWLGKYAVHYKKTASGGITKYTLDCCPFDSNHKGKDACLFQMGTGAIGFKCFHNSCSDKTWKDVRLLYEPDAYSQKYEQAQKVMYQSYNRNQVVTTPAVSIFDSKPKEGTPVWLSAIDIFNQPKMIDTFIMSGITVIDQKLNGLKKGYVSVWSGLRGSSKSTVLSQIALNARQNNYNVAAYSGELISQNFMRWMNLQAAGKAHTIRMTEYSNYFSVADETAKAIAEWLGDRFWLYNNDYGSNFIEMISRFEKAIQEKKLDLLILDNLMTIDTSGLSQDKWDAQKLFIFKLQSLAKKYNVHIAFVAHPKKAMGFLRLNDISGSADLGNAVDNAFIVHRVNNDFKRLTKEAFGWRETDDIYQCSNVIEICKDRDNGTVDEFVPLWYEVESKRLKNSKDETTVYGWTDGWDSAKDCPFA